MAASMRLEERRWWSLLEAVGVSVRSPWELSSLPAGHPLGLQEALRGAAEAAAMAPWPPALPAQARADGADWRCQLCL